ncbi:MAG TPA: DUF5808 domain-containing protein [Vicinamibacterales bacterium]|nr:DUF5808 domain-containing protein [Vicinamibacterales bacterium]
MNPTLLLALVIGFEVFAVGAMLLIQPFVMRRGLVFGVYVGEQAADGPGARRIRRHWIAAMLGTMAAAILAGGLMLALRLGPPPLAPLVSALMLVAGSYAIYLRAYFQARRLAVAGAPPAAAPLIGEVRYSRVLPLTALAVATAGGLVALGYASVNYQRLPDLVPTHFGPSGRPDAWSPRSLSSVMILPLMTLLMGIAMAVMSLLVTRAKRAIRYPDAGVSVDAQQRFRQVSANFLALIVIVMTVMLTLMSIYSIRTGLGLAGGMPGALMAIGALLVVVALGGGLYIAIRYGQGGARLERRAASAPLTNGLADNSRWVLGAFYVNRDDPSILVEKRFGIGYTLNFGNPKAVALLVLFLAIVAFVVVTGITMPQTGVNPSP